MSIIQLLKNKKVRKLHKTMTRSLEGSPQKRGFCLNIIKEKPKKPNSAKRSVAKIMLSTNKRIRAYIPGEGHNLQKYKRVLIRGGHVRDLPGIRYKVIRGKYDCLPVYARRKGFSKYGVKSKYIKKEKLNIIKGN